MVVRVALQRYPFPRCLPGNRSSMGSAAERTSVRRSICLDKINILTVNLLFSTLIFRIAARIYLFPRLAALEPKVVLLPILLLHATRHLGLMFLAPGATYAGIPAQFAYPAAFGDLLAAGLALIAIPAGCHASAHRKIAGLDLQHRRHARPVGGHRACDNL